MDKNDSTSLNEVLDAINKMTVNAYRIWFCKMIMFLIPETKSHANVTIEYSVLQLFVDENTVTKILLEEQTCLQDFI